MSCIRGFNDKIEERQCSLFSSTYISLTREKERATRKVQSIQPESYCMVQLANTHTHTHAHTHTHTQNDYYTKPIAYCYTWWVIKYSKCLQLQHVTALHCTCT